MFQTIYQDIDARKDDPDVDKDELKSTVQLIQQEAAKGDQANGTKVQRWLQNLGQIAPDILQVTAATLLNPVAGVATALQKIAQRVSQQSGS
jgi:hypothetical protein